MSLQVGGMRQQPPSVRHIAKCLNPHCGNSALTRLQDYVACNRCGWNSRMNATDTLNKFGPFPTPKAAEPAKPSGETALPSAADLDVVAAEQKAADDTAHVIVEPNSHPQDGGPEMVATDVAQSRKGKNRR